MSREKIHDYLSKQLSIENAVVTFRLLSREMEIHVNVAKKELETYRKDVESYAMYLITGILPQNRPSDSRGNDMDVDGENEEWDKDYAEDDGVQELQTLLVGEETLESSKSQFAEVYSVHVYSLSSARLLDADLICPATDRVRQIDNSDKGPKLAQTVGRIIGSHVAQAKVIVSAKGKGKVANATSSSSRIAYTAGNDNTKSKEAEKPKPGVPEPKNLKGSNGQLDWSKAKSKEDTKKVNEKEIQQPEKAKDNRNTTSGVSSLKRGVKRNYINSESDEDAKTEDALPASKPTNKASSSAIRARVKNGVVLSDDDDITSVPIKGKAEGKIKVGKSDAEKSLRVMMDIDDDEVEKVTRVKSRPSLSNHVKEEEEDSTQEEKMYEESEPEVIKPKPRKKKEKKVIPVGKNGLKKKKIIKSRMKMDEEGYMVTEDYSSYESVDEEEIEGSDTHTPKEKGSNVKPTEAKTKARASSSKDLNRKASSSGLAKKPKPQDESLKSATSQKKMMNFFGKRS